MIHLVLFLASLRRTLRRESRERFQAERRERASILRVHAARQRYELHLAEGKRRELSSKERSKHYEEKKALKHKKNSSSTSTNNIIKLVKAMETGMLVMQN